LVALLSCAGRGVVDPRVTPSPVDAGIDAPADAAVPRREAVEVEGETAGDAADAPPFDPKEEAPSYGEEPTEDDPSAAGKGPGCSLMARHLSATEDAILAARGRGAPAVAHAPWDHHTPPLRLDLVKSRFGLTPAEARALDRQGFVVPARLQFPSYTVALHEVYQSELPIYISVDSIFQIIFATNDEILETMEGRRLAPLVEGVLGKLHEALRAAAVDYPPEVAADLDLYLSVARTLLSGSYVDGALGPEPRIRTLVASAMKADALETVDLFGRERVVDFSQYKPRGHYTHGKQLARYFRAAMWLSRLELNLASRSCRSSQPGFTLDPTETPREATLALALADLAERSGAMTDIGLLDAAWGLFAGPREDVPLPKIAELRRRAGIGPLTTPGAAERLRAAIGSDFQRTARIHYMPQGATDLPAITTLLARGSCPTRSRLARSSTARRRTATISASPISHRGRLDRRDRQARREDVRRRLKRSGSVVRARRGRRACADALCATARRRTPARTPAVLAGHRASSPSRRAGERPSRRATRAGARDPRRDHGSCGR
jgi:hypothetical protein